MYIMWMKQLSFINQALKREWCSEGKCSKEWITVLLCTNTTGMGKLEPLAIEKYKSPRCFKNIHHLLCNCHHNKKAWMTGNLIKQWLQRFEERRQRSEKSSSH